MSKRPDLGCRGRAIKVRANYFEVTSLPDSNIYLYEFTITPVVPSSLKKKYYITSFQDKMQVFLEIRTMYTTRIAELDMEQLHRFLDGNCSSSINIQRGFEALDVLIRYKSSMMHITHQEDEIMYATYGRTFYTNQDSKSIFGGAEIWQGIYQSIKPTPHKLMVNIDICGTAFYENCSLVQMVTKLLGLSNPDDLRRGIQDHERCKLQRALKGLKIHVNHLDSKRTYRIVRITNIPTSDIKFEIDGKITDAVSYFKKSYNSTLQFPFLPCVTIREDITLPIELCEVAKGQRWTRKMNERQTADMSILACLPPRFRAKKIRQSLDILKYQENEYLRKFGMSVSNAMATFEARILPAPMLHYHPSSLVASFIPSGGLWSMRNKKFAFGATLYTGMNITNKFPPIVQCNPLGNIEQSLKQAWIKAGNMTKSPPQLILCILPNTAVPLYAEIKRRPSIILSANVIHLDDCNRSSIAALCASLDAKAYRYAASIRFQRIGMGHIEDLSDMVKELLKTFYQHIGRKPERILFYRDGIIEESLKDVVEALKTAFRLLETNYNPTITYITVQRAHHTRFFPMNKSGSDRLGNCLPGTVVDSTITHPFEFDFYLTSHANFVGTSRPTHYHVLFDENQFTSDSLQTLSYNLCHLYARSTCAVSVVSPVYYARLLCKRAKFHYRYDRWKDSNSDSSESSVGIKPALNFAKVMPELRKTMYFI
ncbi:11322_t:CDS:2 [Funneliformis geosporum]|uniref:11322_t:CDS:1 n=1 Tax=Funneliformis geosporum TaxID=1117311 RepID=A0A9W4SDC3_9GLOM|nr:11322_t:CDS:2 [Funneliformis geosporum]